MSKLNATLLVWLCFFLNMGKYRNHNSFQVSYLTETICLWLSRQRSTLFHGAMIGVNLSSKSHKLHP